MASWQAVALTIVGTVVGAGFASGQEVWQFFTRGGEVGALGILLAMGLFAGVSARALEAGGRGLTLDGYLQRVWGRWAAGWDVVAAAFLTVGLGVVGAASGELLHATFRLSAYLGAVLALAVLVLCGSQGSALLLRLNSWLVPPIIGVLLLLAWVVPAAPAPPPSLVWPWWVMAILYASYNLFSIIPVLLPLGRTLPPGRSSWIAAGAGSATLAFMAWCEHRILGAAPPGAALPLYEIALAAHPLLGVAWSLVLWLALFTTGVATVFALKSRWGDRAWLWWGVAFALPLWPFAGLVANLYPVIGAISIFLWMPLLLGRR